MRSLFLIFLFLVGCASTPKPVERAPLCSGKKLSVTFAINQKPPKGIPLDRLHLYNRAYNVVTDYLVQNYYKMKATHKGELAWIFMLSQPVYLKKISDEPLKYEISREKIPFDKRRAFGFCPSLDGVEGTPCFYFRNEETAQPDIYQFFKDNYLANGEIDQVLENITIIRKKVEGDWIVQEVSIDENELCKNVRPRTDLYSQ